MGIYNDQDPLSLELLLHEGWHGAPAAGDFGAVEAWVQLQPGAPGPSGYGSEVTKGNAKLCGQAADGHLFAV